MSLRQSTGAAHARIHGVGAYRPERVVTNDEVCELIDSDDEWIRSRSGIESRHRARPDETVIDMAVAASLDALDHAGVRPDQVGAVLVATVTHPAITPTAAAAVAHRIGATPAAALDLQAACAGYCHGVALADGMVRTGSAQYVLVVGVEKLSDFVDPTDRSTAFLFGDGAGAVVIGPADSPGIGPTVWGSDGSAWDTIRVARTWTDLRDDARAAAADPGADLAAAQDPRGAAAALARGEMPWSWITMEGRSVFRWASFSMPDVCTQALDAAGVRPDELGAFIPHQANQRIVDTMVKRLGLPESVPVADDVRTTANTSSASIPLAMERMLREGRAASGDLALQIGYGAGLAYAAQVVVLP